MFFHLYAFSVLTHCHFLHLWAILVYISVIRCIWFMVRLFVRNFISLWFLFVYSLSLAQSSALCVFALSHLWWMKLKHRGFNHANNRCSFVECAKKLFVFLGGSVFFVFSISMWITGMKANTEFDDTWQGPTYEFLKAFVGQTVGIHQQYNAEHSLRRTLRGRNCVGN